MRIELSPTTACVVLAVITLFMAMMMAAMYRGDGCDVPWFDTVTGELVYATAPNGSWSCRHAVPYPDYIAPGKLETGTCAEGFRINLPCTLSVKGGGGIVRFRTDMYPIINPPHFLVDGPVGPSGPP